MVIRTFKKQKNIKKNLIILLFMIVGIIVVAELSNIVYDKITQSQGEITPKVGEKLTFVGTISDENNFPLYTHKISNQNGDSIFLISSSINLNDIQGEIEVLGEIKNIKNNIPTIDVYAIKFPEQGLIIKNNTYFFVKDMLYLDFSQQKNLSAKKTDKDIDILFDNQKIVSIERFLCSRVLRQKDCSYLIEDYGKSQKSYFDSYRGYTYYKHGTGLRTMFDGSMFGYIFKDVEDKTISEISNIIRIIDKKFILENKENIIKEACANQGETINQIYTSTIQYEDNNIINIILESTKNKQRCKVSFDMRNEREITQTEILE